AIVDLTAAKQLIYATNDLLEHNSPLRGGIYDITEIDHITDDARTYLSDNTDIKGTVVGVALISNSFIGKMVGNLFITLGGPRNYPIRFFESGMRAEHWVRQQMETAKNLKAVQQDVA
ncbi:MAG: hypothetical protein ACPG5W_09205, partial [Flavobacteriales bacterium]